MKIKKSSWYFKPIALMDPRTNCAFVFAWITLVLITTVIVTGLVVDPKGVLLGMSIGIVIVFVVLAFIVMLAVMMHFAEELKDWLNEKLTGRKWLKFNICKPIEFT